MGPARWQGRSVLGWLVRDGALDRLSLALATPLDLALAVVFAVASALALALAFSFALVLLRGGLVPFESWITPGSNKELAFHKIPNFNLTNQLGETVTQNTFNDKIYIADFFFTSCPGICPKMTSNMAIIQEEFKNDSDVLLLSHSVTPTIDSVSVLKTYAENNNVIDHKWHLVT